MILLNSMDIATATYRIFAIILIVLYYLIILSDMKTKKVTTVYILLFAIVVAVTSTAIYLKRKKIEAEQRKQALHKSTIASVRDAEPMEVEIIEQ